MKCKNCGKEISDDASFCTGCGAAIAAAPAGKKRGKLYAGIAAAAVCICAAAVALGFFAYSHIQKTKAQEELMAAITSVEQSLSASNLGEYGERFDEEISRAMSIYQSGSTDELKKAAQDIGITLDEINSAAALNHFKQECAEGFSGLVIADELKANYNSFTDSIEKALMDGGKTAEDFRSEYTELMDSIVKNNKAQVSKLNERVAELSNNISFNEADKVMTKSFSSALSAGISDGDYSVAIDTLNSWIKYLEAASADNAAAPPVETVTTIIIPQSAYSSQSIIPYSSSRYLSVSDVAGLSSYELMLARNEIFARHGRRFDNPELQQYFNSKSWYRGAVSPSAFNASVLNPYEKANIELIKSFE